MTEINDLSTTAANNNLPAPDGWPEGQIINSINNASREDLARLARWYGDHKGSITTAGTLTAYTYASARTITAYYDGLDIVADFHVTCGASPTFNVDAVAAAPLIWPDGTALVAGDIPINAKVMLRYDGVSFQVMSVTKPLTAAGLGLQSDVITTRGDVIRGSSTGAAERLALGSNGQVLVSDGTDVAFSNPVAVNPRGHLAGLGLANNSVDAAKDIDVAVGACRDDTNTEDMTLGSTLVKQIDATWAVGTNAGGLDTGAVAADTWYHVFVIKRTDTDVVDALFSLSATAPTLPTNYDKQRRIGSVLTDATPNIIAFNQRGNRFLTAAVTDVNDTTPPTALTAVTVTTPLGVETRPLLHINMTSNSTPDDAVITLANGADTLEVQVFRFNQNSSRSTSSNVDWVWTNTSSQIKHRSSNGALTLNIVTNGWIDSRGQDD